ncbi:hypothetical protein NG798_22645 [Ancylothrix sp. C2]|uniref:hypothetical protein n=1 Tax=Ancylothrix sp. D3o TaxID=2953691 RepID=UPI0021BB76A7|nr:hypothetical protein [Ancylothrix sp. D3o]MCT7952600.1 hypothetical protein [Ancylothrix sp. D3o]
MDRSDSLRRNQQAKLFEYLKDHLPDPSNAAIARYLTQTLRSKGSREQVSNDSVGRWTLGEQLIRRDSVRKLALALGCSVIELEEYLSGQLGTDFLDRLQFPRQNHSPESNSVPSNSPDSSIQSLLEKSNLVQEKLGPQEGISSVAKASEVLAEETEPEEDSLVFQVKPSDEASVVNAVFQLMELLSVEKLFQVSMWGLATFQDKLGEIDSVEKLPDGTIKIHQNSR